MYQMYKKNCHQIHEDSVYLNNRNQLDQSRKLCVTLQEQEYFSSNVHYKEKKTFHIFIISPNRFIIVSRMLNSWHRTC